jgi:hypothetical protein
MFQIHIKIVTSMAINIKMYECRLQFLRFSSLRGPGRLDRLVTSLVQDFKCEGLNSGVLTVQLR